MKKNTLASSLSARERTTVPSLRAKRPLVSTTSQRCAGNFKRDKLSMTWNADSKWCERAGGSHGSHLAEGRPLWNDDARFGEDLERRFKKNKTKETYYCSFPERFVSVTSSTAARIFNIWPQVFGGEIQAVDVKCLRSFQFSERFDCPWFWRRHCRVEPKQD